MSRIHSFWGVPIKVQCSNFGSFTALMITFWAHDLGFHFILKVLLRINASLQFVHNVEI